ncbi:vWA domain-containing protein [Jeotgalibacillus soli]|uniref:VWFA domain-containing protein n=1 Tax=Jeotgalibacillus soli TaxID=889306 RepID=A0A0C2VN69_9BACL|nr:VWA domain-containing protein [Jeotgalibacillus soli]KIL45448.1 hypothetical protein KP78_29920 [Jeotgalibacillus soli]
MERFIQFNDESINSFRLMELTDLAKTLTKIQDIDVEYGPLSYADLPGRKIIVSHFWDHRSSIDEVMGLKSDIYLCAVGTMKYSDIPSINKYIFKTKKRSIRSFSKQLLIMIEDLRIEEEIKRVRPGTKKAFNIRRRIYTSYFESQLNVHLVKGVSTDALFNMLYLMLNAQSPISDWPKINSSIDMAMPFIQQQIERSFDIKSTAEATALCNEICEVLDEILAKDMLNEYFHLPEQVMEEWESSLTYKDLKRDDPLVNCDHLKEEATGNEEVMKEEFSTWHRESSDKGESFLQFDLDQGSSTNIKGNQAREGDEGDQALGMIQGASRKSQHQQFDNQELDLNSEEQSGEGETDYFGRENRYAHPVFQSSNPIAHSEQQRYDIFKKLVVFYQKKLQRMIEKTLDHKKIQPRTNLAFGRLSKRLIPFLTDDQPKIFYKKDEKSPEIDATFTLLLDCSASMHDKMEETKKGLVLFHEALKSLYVPHEIVGFWEDTNNVSETSQPNYMKTVISYHDSIYTNQGAAIMQLQPEEDNRDGYAIRHMTKRLLSRKEKQRFLMVFSDGEPAAMNYEQNGVMDTHEAVINARKNGIEVMNLFLSNGEVTEGQKEVIRNMYGKYSLFISNIEELPDVLFPLLKRLLYKSI